MLRSIYSGLGCALISIFTVGQLSAQSNPYFDPDNFSGIKCQGEIPADFTRSWADRFRDRHRQPQGIHGNRGDKEQLEEFWSTQYYFIDRLLHSGQVVFNDPATLYLNRIKDELLKDDPKLSKEIRVYLNRSPFVNAACVADGIILFNVGLFAYAKTEAELAFVLSHEIQHYKQGHLFNSFEEREKILEGSIREYRRMHPIAKVELLTMQSQEHEFDADAKGIDLYLQSAYNRDAAESLLSILHQAYMPYGRKEVGPDFLATASTRLPEVFFRDEVAAISQEEDYFDETHNHPNIAKRRMALEEYLKNDRGGHADFVQDRAEFFALRELMRFERLRELVINGFYGDALYDIYGLRDQYPDSKFLNIAEAKALYGLAGYKVKRAFRSVAKSTSRQEGPSQQAHHVIKQFDKNQLTAFALHVVRQNQQRYPDEKYLERYASELCKYLVVDCRLTPDDFKVLTDKLPAFTKTAADFSSDRSFFRAQQNHYRDFYKYPLQADYKSGWLSQEMKAHAWLLDSLNTHINMDRRSKNDIVEARQEEREEGNHIQVRDLIMLDPYLHLQKDNQDSKDRIEAFEKEQAFKQALPALLQQQGIAGTVLFSENIKASEVDRYNQLAALKEWLREADRFRQYRLLPTSIDISEELYQHYNTRYICNVRGLVADGSDSYYFQLYDLKKGKVVYANYDKKGFNLSLKDLLSEAEEDLARIYN